MLVVHSLILRVPGPAAMSDVVLESILSCLHCGFARQESMPADACRLFYECANCKALLRFVFLRFHETSAYAAAWML